MSATTKPAASVEVSRLVIASAGIELVTGIILIVAPALFGRLLLGAALVPIALGIAPLAGIALVALAIACWPRERNGATTAHAAIPALLAYNFLAVLYFCYWRVAFQSEGPLLWPAVAIHGTFTVLFCRAALRAR